MPRVRRSSRGAYGQERLQNALQDLRDGVSVRSTANRWGIPAKTLRRHRDGKVRSPGQIHLGRFSCEFSPEQEELLVEKIQFMEKVLYGLTTFDLRRIAFQFAERLGIKHRFSRDSKMAGKEWLNAFLKRHPGLAIRKPEPTSLARAVGFNRPQVDRFYALYRELLDKNSYGPLQVWNADETGVSVVQKPANIVAPRGKKQVGKITSAERGKTVTVICAANAGGQFVPPAMIFPRARMNASLMNGAPPGAIGMCTKSGWTDEDCFVKWLQHFISTVRPSTDNRHLLILDGHASHKSLHAVELARESGVDLITLPPHCTHRLQPLDVSWFKPLKAAYSAAADSWMRANPGRRISEFEISAIFSTAYLRCASAEKIVSGFRVSGIWPFDDSLFTDNDFVAALLTEEPEPQPLQEAEPTDPVASSSGSSGRAQGSVLRDAEPTNPVASSSGSSGRAQGSVLRDAEPTDSVASSSGSSGRAQGSVLRDAEPTDPVASSSGYSGRAQESVLRDAEPTDPVASSSCYSGRAQGSVLRDAEPTNPVASSSCYSGRAQGSVLRDAEPTNPVASSSGSSGRAQGSVLRDAEPTNSVASSSTQQSPSSRNRDSQLLADLCASPKAHVRKRIRRAQKSEILTSSPMKSQLEEKAAKKRAKKDTSNGSLPKKSKKMKKSASETPQNTDDKTSCLVCGMQFRLSCEEWVQCAACSQWACVPCTDLEKGQLGYTCDFCRPASF
ncbi:uncharacterized protein LOC122378365 [Amphibalanus amphitrite]|uniref:uncharacterized protein LOC122376362 n=1 Tax=Amphibalanus amphitrite TaxID=1232801 RepID=UPI001C914510|nr:uncharacterized protein LOC122376362 [Amphibalanus amphitrite]XP_043215282.1 uncharacterized protein LOC122378365 [Amphibalanus amphitrite]